jgi:DNA polymerase III epsilon subunit
MSRIVVIDTETTGLDYLGGHRVIEIAAIEIVDGVISRDKYFQSYLNPEGKKSAPKALKVHGLETEFLASHPKFKDIAEPFLDFLSGAELVTYNRKFDFGFIQAELDRAKIDVVLNRDFKSSCLMEDVKAKLGIHKWLKLDDACRRYSIDISLRKIHGAHIDAELTAELYLKFHTNDVIPLSKTPQINKHSPTVAIPIPRAFRHPKTGVLVQVNHCKNPDCENYCVPAKNPTKSKSGKLNRGLVNDYKLTNVRDGKSLTCTLCKTSTILVNNRAYVLESLRVENESSPKGASCPNEKILKGRGKGKPCKNNGKDIFSHPELYSKKGKKTSSVKGSEHMISQRYECKECNKRFYVSLNPQMGQQQTSINKHLFTALVNKGVINRIQEQLGVTPPFIYRRIQFFYEQCIQFEKWHIKNNLHKLANKPLEISMDRQHYLANWNTKKDKRPTKLVNTSSVDNRTRYVLASTLNFDFNSDWEAIKKDHRKRKDGNQPVYQRIYSQYVISDTDVESDDVDDALALKAPSKHLLVQQTYSLMAHLNLVKPFYEVASQVNLFADDDEGFEMGICLVMSDFIKQQKLYPVLISAERNNASQMQDKRSWSEQVLRDQGISDAEIKKAQLDPERLRKLAQKYWSAEIHQRNGNIGSSKSEWLVHPFPKHRQTMQIKPLVGTLDELTMEITDSLLDVSTYGVDNYFQLIRRRINMLERPITSATNGLRWNGYASYNPKWAAMLIEIFRVYNNFILTDAKTLKNKKSSRTPTTPAQKLKLANKAYNVEDILQFSPLTSTV